MMSVVQSVMSDNAWRVLGAAGRGGKAQEVNAATQLARDGVGRSSGVISIVQNGDLS